MIISSSTLEIIPPGFQKDNLFASILNTKIKMKKLKVLII